MLLAHTERAPGDRSLWSRFVVLVLRPVFNVSRQKPEALPCKDEELICSTTGRNFVATQAGKLSGVSLQVRKDLFTGGVGEQRSRGPTQWLLCLPVCHCALVHLEVATQHGMGTPHALGHCDQPPLPAHYAGLSHRGHVCRGDV